MVRIQSRLIHQDSRLTTSVLCQVEVDNYLERNCSTEDFHQASCDGAIDNFGLPYHIR